MSLQIISIPPRKTNLYLLSQPSTPTSQKTITASLLSRWGNDALTKTWKNLSSIHGSKKQKDNNTVPTSINGESFVKIVILV